METRRKTEPIVDKIRRGEVSVFVAVAEEMPEVFRTHVVRKVGLRETLTLAQVNKSYNAAVWSVEAVKSLDEKAEAFAKLHSNTSVYPPLHICSQFNNVKAIKALISSGVDLEERSTEIAKPRRHGHVTALHVAAQYSNFEAAKLLLEAGADVNAITQLPKPNGGATPLYFAVYSLAASASPKLVSLLLEAGADVTLKVAFDDENGSGLGLDFDTVLGFYTCDVHARAEVVKMFLDAGADPNCQDTNFGQAPLHNVAEVCVYEVVKFGKLLLEYGADPLLADEDGKTPLDYAKKVSKGQDLIDLLTEATEKALKSSA
jgi:ankyrin repeat protein